MQREPDRWQTPFGEWVLGVGAREVVEHLAEAQIHVTPDAVYKWVAGAHVPRPEVAIHLVEYSGGRVSLMDIFTQRVQLERMRGDSCIGEGFPPHSRP